MNVLIFFLALDAKPEGQIQHENTKQIKVVALPLDNLYKMASKAEITDSITALSVILA